MNLKQERHFVKDDDLMSVSEVSMDEDTLFNLMIQTRLNQQQRISLNTKQKTKQILYIFKTNDQQNNQQIEEYQNQLPQLRRIIQCEQKNVIDQEKIIEIKQNVQKQIPQIINQNINYEDIPLQQEQNNWILKEEQNKQKQAQQQLQKKMQRMFEERQLVHMLREDERSMKVEIDIHKSYFKQRFFTPILKTVKSNHKSINLPMVSVCYTYTNIIPQMNNQQNTFSKHSPIIALQSLKKLNKTSIHINKSTLNPITITQNLNPEENLEIKQKQNDIPLIFPQYMVKKFNSFSINISKLEQISTAYKPKFLNDHLDQQQRGQNFSLPQNQDQKQSLKDFLTITNYQKAKQLKITYENLTDILYIQTLPNLQYVSFKHNKLTSVQHLINNQYIIELNLSYNKIKQMQGVQYLKHLRHLNMQNNEIQTIANLQCQQLQILHLKNNGIRRITNLKKIVNLRYLDVSNNKLQNMQGLSNLLFLNTLNLSKNKIEQIKGIQNCLLLKQLFLSSNNIARSQPLNLVFLSKLMIDNNNLSRLPEMFLPSLEQLNLSSNKLIDTNKNIFLPRLKIVNLDQNLFEFFSPIWSLLKHSFHCEVINYNKGEQFSYVPLILSELYESMIYKKMKKLKILNQNAYSNGTKMYFESQHDSLIHQKIQNSNVLFDQLSSKISLVIAENKFIDKVDKSKHQFRKEIDFVKNKSVKMVDDLKTIYSFMQGKGMFIEISPIFSKYDTYAIKKIKALQRIQTLTVSRRYKNNKRVKYFKDNLPTIKKYIIQLLKDSKIFILTKVIRKFAQVCGEDRKHQCANVIKSSWRLFKNKKVLQKLRQNFRKNKNKTKKIQEQQEDFEQIDLDFLTKQYNYTTKMRIPQHMNFQSLVYKPQILQKASELVQNAMLYQQSDTSSRIGSMQNTSSTQNHSTAFNQSKRNMSKNKNKKILPPIDIQVDRIIASLRLQNVTSQVRQQIKKGALQNRRRQKKIQDNQKTWQKYSYKRF